MDKKEIEIELDKIKNEYENLKNEFERFKDNIKVFVRNDNMPKLAEFLVSEGICL